MLPALKETEETGSGSLFYRAFYVEKVQDLLRSRPNRAIDPRADKLEKIWVEIKNATVEPIFSFVKNTGDLIPSGKRKTLSSSCNYALIQLMISSLCMLFSCSWI